MFVDHILRSKARNSISRTVHFDPTIGLPLLRRERANPMVLVPKTLLRRVSIPRILLNLCAERHRSNNPSNFHCYLIISTLRRQVSRYILCSRDRLSIESISLLLVSRRIGLCFRRYWGEPSYVLSIKSMQYWISHPVVKSLPLV